MKLFKIVTSVLALGLATAPVAAQATAPFERSSAPIYEDSNLSSAVLGPAIIIILIAELGMLALVLSDDDDDFDSPVSA